MGLEDLGIRGWVETIQTTDCWDRPEYLEEFWKPVENYIQSDSCEKPSANAGVKNSQGVK